MQIRFRDLSHRRAILIDGRPHRDSFLELMLSDRGIAVVATYDCCADFASLKSIPDADLLIVYVATAASGPLGSAVQRFAGPVVAMVETDDPAAVQTLMDCGAHSVVCVGPSSDRFKVASVVAVSVWERLKAEQARADSAERALQERKLIERAKGILMQQRGLNEPDAQRELQNKSMQRNEPLVEVARGIIAAKELLG